MIIDASVAKKLASVITITSRLITCVSSCAITPSSSAGLEQFEDAGVAHTVVDFFERPIANAFGIDVSIVHTLGLGRSACTHSRSTIPCSSGSCAGVDLLDPQRRQRDLVRGEQLIDQQHHRDDHDDPAPAPTANSTPMNTT